MSIHNRGLDGRRPVHPMCDADEVRPCQCDHLWGYAERDDFEAMESVEQKRFRRGQPMPVLGLEHGPDADDKDDKKTSYRPQGNPMKSYDVRSQYAPSIQLSELELAGFWNRAEQWRVQPVWNVEQDRIAAFNDIQAKWGSEFAHAWLSNVAHGYRLTRTHEQFCWLKSRDYL